MSRKLTDLVHKLSTTDQNSSDFLAISKEIAKEYNDYAKKKLDKKNQKPKPKKEKSVSTCICDNCSKLLLDKFMCMYSLFKKPVEAI